MEEFASKVKKMETSNFLHYNFLIHTENTEFPECSKGEEKKKKRFRLGKCMLIWAKPAMDSPGQEAFGKGRLS